MKYEYSAMKFISGQYSLVDWFTDEKGHRYWRRNASDDTPTHETPRRMCDGCRKEDGLPCGCGGFLQRGY